MAASTGTIYLLHFERPYRHARHYVGWTRDLEGRLADHRAGAGARLLQVLAEHGIGWRLAAAVPGDRGRERELKRRRWSTRRCPECGTRIGRRPAT